MLSLLTPPRIELITRLKKVAAVDTYSRREFCWLYSLLGSSLNQRRETGLSAPREARSRGSRSDITTLHVTPCSNLTNTNPVCGGRTTTAGSQIESHTQTVESSEILISGMTP